MSFARHSFLLCYLEAWLFWLGGHVIIDWIQYFQAKFTRELAPRPFGFVESLADPFFLIANALLVVLFAALLIGKRRPTRTTN